MLGSFAQCPERNETPTHEHDLALTGISNEADHGLKGLGRYVPARAEVGKHRTVDSECFCDLLLI